MGNPVNMTELQWWEPGITKANLGLRVQTTFFSVPAVQDDGQVVSEFVLSNLSIQVRLAKMPDPELRIGQRLYGSVFPLG
jgi:hypothetical protein